MNKKSAVYLLLPAFLAVLVFTFYPLIQITIPTLNTKQGFLRLYTQFLKSTYNWEVLQRTFIIAIITMLIVLILGLPVSLWIARQKRSFRQVLSVLILFPMLTNAVVRNFAWIIILGKNGVINQTLMALHIAKSPVSILYTDTSIIVGSAYLFLPIMITSLVGSVSELNIETEEAAAVLGANPWTSLFKIIIPQLTTGIFTGSILVFAGTMTAYTTPQILGGNRHLVMSTLIYQQAMTLGNWDNASAIAIVLILISALSMTILRLIGKKLDRRPGLA
ncbi:spermidine/putrescine ABC transporter permease [Lactobacillus delbrueckii subsp. bulgaricus]|nr:spermidine/putrescine ABC transporter permease [Lactobacillus delbrueckii subsp. bulgaricus]MBT8810303.1 spermidine/putrescine ABC transporter permease [Lactobacillus delbrueckii subsp. bulgaricus]MBT8811539.1 spermidine/putrescine ABC transporter permease [Lactobacillus delbrueckii subsp. bulgaricus]MBT8827523.1 spermidine/putrescine ABC transporter permease [Lactobacillus delbrueckii subsp. bulgaricus]MBT8836972.1 spermidine/putrescine ABC transporter permease [Lactobacillus delbrueckii su